MGDPMKIRAVAKEGVADVRVLMAHEMETGQRKDGHRCAMAPIWSSWAWVAMMPRIFSRWSAR